MSGNNGEGADTPFSLGFEGEEWAGPPHNALYIPVNSRGYMLIVWKNGILYEILTPTHEYFADDILMAAAIVAKLKEELE